MKIIRNFSMLLCCLLVTVISAQKQDGHKLINKEHTHQYASKYDSIAQSQLDAYNAKDIDAFLKLYADDVEVYSFPDKLIYKGKENMKIRYERMFETTPNLHCSLLNRIIEQNVVIDKEKVQLGDKILLATAIYVIKDNTIQRVYFIQ